MYDTYFLEKTKPIYVVGFEETHECKTGWAGLPQSEKDRYNKAAVEENKIREARQATEEGKRRKGAAAMKVIADKVGILANFTPVFHVKSVHIHCTTICLCMLSLKTN